MIVRCSNAAVFCAAFALLAACDNKTAAKPTPTGTAQATSAGSANRSNSSAATAFAQTPASASAPSSAAPAQPTGVTGAWSGTYDAVKSTIALPAGVSEPAWKADDGKERSGTGSIELEIAADGVVRGKVLGPLGDSAISGLLDGDVLTATFSPETAEGAGMSGTLVMTYLPVKQELSGDLKASSGDAKIVRSATVKLTRKK